MALASTYESREAAPEAIREHLVEVDGKYVLEVEGMKGASEFEGLKDAMKKRIADLGTELKSIRESGLKRSDIEELLKDAGRQVSEPKPGNGEDKQIADLQRTIAGLEEQLTGLKARDQERDQQMTSRAIQGELTAAATKSNIRSESATVIDSIVGRQFEVTADGQVKSRAGCEFGADLTPAEVVAKMKKDPRYASLWPSSKGSGAGNAPGGGEGGGDEGPNPWSRKGWNRTRQTALIAKDRAEAERLARAAGSELGATSPPRGN